MAHVSCVVLVTLVLQGTAITETPTFDTPAPLPAPSCICEVCETSAPSPVPLPAPLPADQLQILKQIDEMNPTRENRFGSAVAIFGHLVIVGSYQIGVNNRGGAYIYETRDNGATVANVTPLPNDAVAWFGYSVAISDSIAVVGAPRDEIGGSAFIYVTTNGGETWTGTAKLALRNPEIFDQLGIAVAISGSLVVVGAPTKIFEDAAGTRRRFGAVYVFRTSDGGFTWTEPIELRPTDLISTSFLGPQFGFYAAMSGNFLLVGTGLSGQGAYVSRTVDDGTTWTAFDELTSEVIESLAISGTLAIVVGSSDSAASIYKTLDGGETWTETVTLTAPSDTTRFGNAVAISNDITLVAATNTFLGSLGFVYIYKTGDGGQTWTETGKFTANEGSFRHAFGSAVALSGLLAVVGAPGFTDVNNLGEFQNDQTGVAYTFALP